MTAGSAGDAQGLDFLDLGRRMLFVQAAGAAAVHVGGGDREPGPELHLRGGDLRQHAAGLAQGLLVRVCA